MSAHNLQLVTNLQQIYNKSQVHTNNLNSMKQDESSMIKDTPLWEVQPNWHAMTKEEVLSALQLAENHRTEGLSTEEVTIRLEKYGRNMLSSKKKKTLLEKIWEQIANVLVGILLFVAAISIVRVFTDDPVTNGIQVGIIIGVIM